LNQVLAMKIDSGLSGYQYPTRAHATGRIAEEAGPREAEQPWRSGSTLTGSSTLLSSSLASALWGLADDTNESAATVSETSPGANGVTADWVKELYLEFSDNT